MARRRFTIRLGGIPSRIWRALLDSVHRKRGSPAKDGHVLVFHTGRCGSSILGDLLDQHPKIRWGSEAIEILLHQTARRRKLKIAELAEAFDCDAGLQAIEHQMTASCGPRIFGIELQGYHVEFLNTQPQPLFERLRALGFTRYVILSRENPMRQLVSHLLAGRSGIYHIHHGAQVELQKLHIDPERVFSGYRYCSLAEALDRYDRFMQSARQLVAGSSVLEISYDRDIRENPLAAYNMVCEFLGVQAGEPKIRLGLTTPHALEDILENYDEVATYLANTRHAWMLPARGTVVPSAVPA